MWRCKQFIYHLVSVLGKHLAYSPLYWPYEEGRRKKKACPVSEKTLQSLFVWPLERNNLIIQSISISSCHLVSPLFSGRGQFNVGAGVMKIRLQFGVAEESKLTQSEALFVPLRLPAVLRMKPVCLGAWMWGCLHNTGISFSPRWPPTCLLNEFDIDMNSLSGGSLRGNSGAFQDDRLSIAVNRWRCSVMDCKWANDAYCCLIALNAEMVPCIAIELLHWICC